MRNTQSIIYAVTCALLLSANAAGLLAEDKSKKKKAAHHRFTSFAKLSEEEKVRAKAFWEVDTTAKGTHNPLYALHKEYNDRNVWVKGEPVPTETLVKNNIRFKPNRGHFKARGTLLKENKQIYFKTDKCRYLIYDMHIHYQLQHLGALSALPRKATVHAYWIDHKKARLKDGLKDYTILYIQDIDLHHPHGEPRPLIQSAPQLRGWRTLQLPAGNPYTGGDWQAEKINYLDGKKKRQYTALVGKRLPDDKKGGWLQSYERFDDFELTVDVKPDWGCDTGILLRQNMRGEGIQVTIDYRNGGNIGFLHGQGIGSFYTRPFSLKGETDATGNLIKLSAEDHYDAVKQDGLLHACTSSEFLKAWKINGWNTIKVRCTGKDPNITVWVNGLKTIEMKSSQFKARHPRKPEIPVYDPEKVFFHTDGKGHIGLQIHPGKHWKLPDGKVMYRNIMIKEL